MREFGSLGEVLGAGDLRQAHVLGDEPELARHLAAMNALFVEALRIRVADAPVLASSRHLRQYLSAVMAYEPHEQVRALFLNAKNMLIRDEVVAWGDATSASVSRRVVMRRALELGATGLILVHNHPSGNPTPSASDVTITRELADAAAALDIALLDHLVIGKSGWISMRQEGML